MLLVKFGGSIITDKSKLRTARRSTIERLAKEISVAQDDMILVHGAGSFGHILAKKYRLHEGYHDNSQMKGVSEVQRDVRELNHMVIDALRKVGASPVSVPPSITAQFKNGQLSSLDVRPFKEYLSLNLIPVTFGDVVIDSEKRFGICSGDDLMVELSKAFEPSLSLFVTDVDGVFTSDPKGKGKPKFLKEVSIEDITKLDVSMRTNVDVTGGLEGKLKKIFASAAFTEETWILNGNVAGRVEDAIRGKSFIGTKVVT